MAVSVLSPLFSFNVYRMNQVCIQICSDTLHKGTLSFLVHLKSHKCNIKLYRIPGNAISYRRVLRPLATAGSLEVDGTHHGNQVSSNALGLKNPRRSENLIDLSRSPFNHVNGLEIQLQELFDEVKALIRMGKKNDAIDLLQANYEAVKEQVDVGARGIEEAATLDIIALGYMAIGDLEVVGSLLDVLNEVVDNLTDDEPFLDTILTHMGSMNATLGKFEKSILLYKRVLKILERAYGNGSTFLVTPLLGMAKVLGSIGRATKAMDIYRRAITIMESNKGVGSEDLVVPLYALGGLLIREGKAVDAENIFSRILNMYATIYGEKDRRIGMAMCSLAHVKCARGNVDEAIGLYRNALQVLKDSNSMGVNDNIMEKMKIDLAELLHAVGRGKEGRVLLEECLLITEKYKGKEHPDLVTHLLNLATSYSQSKNFVEAERLLRTSLRIMMKTVPPDDPSITFPMLHLAITMYNLNQNEEAEQLALEVLRIREKAFERDSLPVGEALDCLVSIQTRLQRDANGLLEHLKRILSIQEKAFGYESAEILETLKKIIFFLDKMGMRDEKFPLQKRLSMLRNKYKPLIQYK